MRDCTHSSLHGGPAQAAVQRGAQLLDGHALQDERPMRGGHAFQLQYFTQLLSALRAPPRMAPPL